MSSKQDDEAVLRMLGGAHFGPDAKVVLPTGRQMDGDEAQALTSFYAPDQGDPMTKPYDPAHGTSGQPSTYPTQAWGGNQDPRNVMYGTHPSQDIPAGYAQPNDREWPGEQNYLPPPIWNQPEPAATDTSWIKMEPKPRSWFARHKVLTGLLALSVALLVAGGLMLAGVAPNPPLTTPPAPLTAAGLAKNAGCGNSSPITDTELFIQDAVACTDPQWASDSANVSFYVFGNNDGRDGWLQLAQTFGDKGVIKGDRWVVEIPDDLPLLPSVVNEIQGKIGGTVVS